MYVRMYNILPYAGVITFGSFFGVVLVAKVFSRRLESVRRHSTVIDTVRKICRTVMNRSMSATSFQLFLQGMLTIGVKHPLGLFRDEVRLSVTRHIDYIHHFLEAYAPNKNMWFNRTLAYDGYGNQKS
jgi:hypothetical protein